MNSLFKNAFIAVITLAAFFTQSVAADTVRLGTEGAYPPYNFVNDNGDLEGFEIDLGNELCKRANLTCEFVKNDWDTIIPNLVNSNYDVIIAGMSITAERDKVIDFTQEYIPPSPSFYVGLSGNTVDVSKANIAAQTATIQADYIQESNAILMEYKSPDETIAAVRNGEADAVLADGDFLSPIVAESGGDLAIIGQVSIGGGVGMGVRESDADLKAKLNKAIDSMKADGSLNKMLKEWFNEGANLF